MSLPVKRFLSTLDRFLGHAEDFLIAGLSLAALALGVMQVVLRYVFNTGFEWNEAVFILVTISAMLMAGVRAVRDDRHVRVDVLPSLLPDRARRALDLCALVSALALCCFFAWCGWLFVDFAKMMDTASPDTGFKDWAVFSIMPVAMLLFALRYLLRIGGASGPLSDSGKPVE